LSTRQKAQLLAILSLRSDAGEHTADLEPLHFGIVPNPSRMRMVFIDATSANYRLATIHEPAWFVVSVSVFYRVSKFALSECRNRGLIVSHLVKPVVHLDAYQIRKGGRKLHPIAEEFTTFLKNYIVEWAGKSDLV
jgi:hypothetical protein